MTTDAPIIPKAGKKTSENSILAVLLTVACIAFGAFSAMLVLRSRIAPPETALETGARSATPPGQGPAELAVGAQIPDFLVRRFGSAEWLHLSKVSGKVTMINFWASWCEACVQEMPSILKLRAAYHAKGFEIVAINLDEEPDKAIPRMIKKLKLDFPVYNDPEGKIAEIFDIHAIPLTVILDSNRKILMIENSELDWDSPEVRAKMEKWLSG
jgi:thiol-disulfide isomerase/thioredoxin